MKPIQPEEISAFIDGELDVERTQAVEEAMAQDAALRAQLAELKRTDILWKSAARSAAFSPAVNFTTPRQSIAGSRPAITALVVVLLALRFLPKLDDVVVLGIVLHCLALAIILPWLFVADRGGEEPTQK